MGAAICAMHYTGMAAATFTASGVAPDLSHSVSVSLLGTTGVITVTPSALPSCRRLWIAASTLRRWKLDLAQAKMELAYVGHAASLGELAVSIAHEINQPLGAVVNSASASLRWLAMQPPNLGGSAGSRHTSGS